MAVSSREEGGMSAWVKTGYANSIYPETVSALPLKILHGVFLLLK